MQSMLGYLSNVGLVYVHLKKCYFMCVTPSLCFCPNVSVWACVCLFVRVRGQRQCQLGVGSDMVIKRKPCLKRP